MFLVLTTFVRDVKDVRKKLLPSQSITFFLWKKNKK